MNKNQKNSVLFTTLAISIGVVLTCITVIYIIFWGLAAGFVALLFANGKNASSHPEVIAVDSINSSCKLDQNAAYYYFKSYNKICAYSFADEEIADIMQEDHYNYINDFAVCDQWIFYLLEFQEAGYTRGELWRYNRTTSEKEKIFDNIDNSYIEIYNGYLLYDDNDHDYFCPVDEDPKSAGVPWMRLFEEDEFNGSEQFMSFNGMIIGRYYNKISRTYDITCIREETSGKRIMPWDVFGTRLLIEDEWYSISDREKWLARGVTNGYRRDTGESQFTVEDGRIVGILPEYNDAIYEALKRDISQGDADSDHLFQIDPGTDQISTIYNTNSAYGRIKIIGYEDGMVYLLYDNIDDESYKVCVRSIDSEEEEELFEISRQNTIFIDWCNDHMIVYNDGGIILVYSVKKRTLSNTYSNSDDNSSR